jgi:hypothetical protein
MHVRRFHYWLAGLTGAGALLVGSAVAVQAASRPTGFAASVTGCDLTTPGMAQVGYAVTNHDRVAHEYRLLVSVTAGGTPLGWAVSLINRVEAGTTATARVPVSLTGPAAGATCSVHAELYDGHPHHPGTAASHLLILGE